MPTKSREYYLTTSSSRDFAWFSFKPPVTRLPSKRKADPTTPYSGPSARRGKLSPTAEKPGQALMAPVDVKAMAQASRTRSELAGSKTSKSRTSKPKNAGPWSDWYLSEDHSYYWRGRQLQNATWDYEITSGREESAQMQEQGTSPTTSSSQLSEPLSPIPEQPLVSPSPIPPGDPTSPKSSWPTIITTSTGYPTEGLSASSSRILMTLPEEVDDPNQPYPDHTGLVPFVATVKPTLPRGNNKSNNNKRPVGPVMRLFQEGRSHKSKAKTQATKSTANDTTTFTKGAAGVNAGQVNSANGYLAQPKNPMTSNLAKKLHARIKSEKELKVDPKKRVKTWLKGVELDLAPIPLDAQGFPIYR